MHEIAGVIAAAHTPLDPDGGLRLELVDALAERARRDGLPGVFVCGTTGEFASLTAEERMRVAERWATAARDDLAVVQHVGGTSLPECRLLARHARGAGVTAVSAIGPYFFRPRGVDELADFCATIAAEAPELPFFYYHLPALSGVDLSMAEFLERAAPRIPNLAGVKFSSLDLVDLVRCTSLEDGRFTALYGIDEALVAGLSLGARGAVGTTYSLVAPLGLRIADAVERGDLAAARRDQARLTAIVDVFLRHGGHPAMKAAMAFTGLDVGPVRPPQRALDGKAADALRTDLETAGFFEIAPAPRDGTTV